LRPINISFTNKISETSGSPEDEIPVGESGNMVEIEFIREDENLPVAVGKTSVIVCGELGKQYIDLYFLHVIIIMVKIDSSCNKKTCA
jgi:hypothetical protein